MYKYISMLLVAFVLHTSSILYAQSLEPDSTNSEFIARPTDSSAPDKAEAKRHQELARLAFDRQDYAEALRHYQHLFITYPSAQTYYNIAVCHSHMEQYELAILNYERALLLEPSMHEARHNLRLLYAETKDGLSDGRALPWLDDLCYSYSADTLVWVSVGLFACIVALFILFRLGSTLRQRQIAFYAMFPFVLLWFVPLAMLAHQYYYHKQAESRAIMTMKQELKPSPTGQGNSIITLHEGTAVFLLNKPLGHWQEVSLGDGRRGWLPLETFTRVQPEATDARPVEI